MAFGKADLINVARLARLSLAEEEMDRLIEDLDRIVGFVTQLSEVDVTGVEPMSYAQKQALSFREDRVFESLGRECVSSSLGFEDGLVRVPKIVD